MIDTLAPDRPDQSFGRAILPRRGWRSRLVPNAHRAQSACDDGPIDTITIANEIAWLCTENIIATDEVTEPLKLEQ